MTQNNAAAALSMLGKWESSSNRRGNRLFLAQLGGYLAPASKRQDQCPEPDIIDLAQSDLAVTVAKWLSRYEKLANVTMLRCEAIHHRSGKTLPYLFAACRLTREIMLCRSEPSSSSYW